MINKHFKSDNNLSLTLGIGATATALLLGSCVNNDGLSKKTKPNIVFILVDDLGWTDTGCFNSSFYETPNIDKLAAEGMLFTNAYAACPVSSPTRASIMTGKYPARINTTDYFGASQPENWRRNSPLLPAAYQNKLPLKEITIAETLKANGYNTFFAGKWHLGGEGWFPENQGFDVNKGGIERGGPYGGKKYFSPYGNPKLTDGPDGEHLPDRLASETAGFIEANVDNPFLAYLSFYSVHTPLMGRPDLVEKYKQKALNVDTALVRFIPEGKRMARQVQEHAVYAAMVEAMDQAVGKVLKKLIDLNLQDNTIIIFMSDNGGLSTSEGSPTSNLPLRAGKGWLYEGGIREPMIIKWPGVTIKGSVCNTPVISTDFYPTILDMAGLDALPEQHIDGQSFTRLLKGKRIKRNRELFWHYPHYGNQGGQPGSAVRVGKYKLIHFYYNNIIELYNLEEDIGEHNNLVKKLPDKVEELIEILDKWRISVDARVPTKNIGYKDPEK